MNFYFNESSKCLISSPGILSTKLSIQSVTQKLKVSTNYRERYLFEQFWPSLQASAKWFVRLRVGDNSWKQIQSRNYNFIYFASANVQGSPNNWYPDHAHTQSLTIQESEAKVLEPDCLRPKPQLLPLMLMLFWVSYSTTLCLNSSFLQKELITGLFHRVIVK